MTDAARQKGRKLLHLYRRGVGGERDNAGRLLLAHLRTHDLTLYDLDPSLPVLQDVALLDNWRESAHWLARLGTAEQDEALTHLVDAPDLSETEMTKLLAALDLAKLAEARVDGWAYLHGGTAAEYRQAAQSIAPADILSRSGALSERLLAATLQAHFVLTHPERTIRAESLIQRHFLQGVVLSLTGQPGALLDSGVRAHLNVEQLARVRALLAQHGAQAEHIALQAAEAFGKSLK